jgi:hypothetical protein
MTDARLPPSERMPSEEQRKKPTCFGLVVTLSLFSFVGVIAGIALLGLIDLWSEKYRPDLRPSLPPLRLYFAVGGSVIASLFGIILTLMPERSNRGKSSGGQFPDDRPQTRG